ncbi:MAG: sialate O-acetylesterase [Sulfitobacter sp.]|nr:sialate O-acetylesterase [Sulfitobacter sp.]
MSAYPTYYILGQEAFLGDVQEEYLTEAQDARWPNAEASIDMYDYQATAVATYDTTPGSANSNTQLAGDTDVIALDVSLVRYLLDELHPSGMAFVKRTDQGVIGNNGSSRWAKTYAESYAEIATPDTAVRALITGRGDTVDVNGFFLCFGYAEGVLANGTIDAAFKTDLQQLISDLRDDYGGDYTPVVLDFPPATFSGATGGQEDSLANARKAIMEVAAADDYVSYVNSDALERSNGSTKWHYSGPATVSQGQAMAEEMGRMIAGKGNVTGLGVPVYAMFGDDNIVGQVPYSFITDDADGDYTGIDGVKTWNWSNQAWETLDGASNSNTSTDGTANFGPDVSMMTKLLAEKHPGETIYIFKLGRDDSSLGNDGATGGSWAESDADIYTEVVTDWNLAKQALLDVEDVIPDVRGLVWHQHQEDVATQALADAYLTNLKAFLTSYRALFKTRTDSAELPVVLGRPQDTGNFTEAWIDTVRYAYDQAAAEDDRITSVNMDDVREHSNGINFSGGGTLDAGELLATALTAY